MNRVLKDPLFSFLLLSLLVFLYYGLVADDRDQSKDLIVIQDRDVDRLIDLYQRTWNSAPDEQTLKELLNKEIKTEIFYQEGLKMNLDHNDEIIRRRLVQKYEFLIKDISEYISPTDEELRAFYNLREDNYLTDELYSFEHKYYSPDKRSNPQQDAELIVERLRHSGVGEEREEDSFHVSSPQVRKSKAEVTQLFGKNFSDALVDTEQWQVIESGYGWHIVRIIDRSEARHKEYDEVRDQVQEDFKAQQLIDYNTKIYDALKDEYDIQWDLSKWKALTND